MSWSAAQRSKFEATLAARRSERRCDICARGGASIFALIHRQNRVMRGAGSIYLCRQCWNDTGAKRRGKYEGPRRVA